MFSKTFGIPPKLISFIISSNRFIKYVGNGSKEETLAYIVLHHSKVNKIYEQEDWNPGGMKNMRGYHLVLEKIELYPDPSDNDKSYVCLLKCFIYL